MGIVGFVNFFEKHIELKKVAQIYYFNGIKFLIKSAKMYEI